MELSLLMERRLYKIKINVSGNEKIRFQFKSNVKCKVKLQI